MKKPVISKRHKILLSDSPELLGAIRESILQTAKVLPLIASTPNQTRALAQIWKPDLIILSGEDMASVCKNLKSSAQTRSIPVIALILNNEMNRRRKVLEAGCDDWLATPIREMDLLTKIQNLTGFLFRKIPRYSFRAPASVFFKNKEFPSQSIDINRRMIFLESQEGLTPAVGQNLELNFQITDNEKVKCWGRMEQLLTRRGFQDEADTLGMLIRFLDLPEKAAKRIDALAIGQSQKKPSQQVRTTGTNLPWLEDKEYLEISKALVSKNSSDSIGKLVVPETTLQDFVEGLSQIEINAFGNDGDHFLQQTVSLRLKLMDELTKWKRELSLHNTQETLETIKPVLSQMETRLEDCIHQDKESEILTLAKIHYEIIRAKIEILFLQGKLPSPISSPSDRLGLSPNLQVNWKHVAILMFFVLSLLVNAFLLFGIKYLPKNFNKINPTDLGNQGIHLRTGYLAQPSLSGWKIFYGNLNPSWVGLADEEKQAYCEKLAQELSDQEVKQIFLMDPKGKIHASIINNEVKIYSP